MKRMQKLLSIGAIICAGAVSPGWAQELRMATPWGGGPWLERDAQGFADRVAELTDGRVSLRPFPGGTLYSPLKVTEAVRSGVAEAGHNWMAYDWGIDKATVPFAGYAGGLTPEAYMLWMYKGGGLELWKEYRAEKFDVVSFPCAILGTEIFLHSNKPVTTLEDFKGLKLRTSGAWAEIASNLGASTVILPGGEVYNALERGVIDATEWGSPEINAPTGFSEIAQYVVVPGVHQPGGFLECQFNKDVWAGISAEDQIAIELAAKLTVFESWLNSASNDLDAFSDLANGPNTVVHLDQSFIDAAEEATAEWSANVAAENEWFARVQTSIDEFKAKLVNWNEYRLPMGGENN